MILSQSELNSLTVKRYGSSESIAAWNETADNLLADVEAFVTRKRDEDNKTRLMDSARRITANH